MDERTKASLLWGAVGALAFLVLAQGYLLVADRRVSPVGLFGVAAVVAAVAAVSTYATDGYLH